MTYACRFRPTDLSTAKTARIEEAIEDTYDSITSAICVDDITSSLYSVAEVAREVAEEYQEASDNWAGGNGNQEFQEKADTCNEFADTLEGWAPSGETDETEIRDRVANEKEKLPTESDQAYEEDLESEQDDAWEAALQTMISEAVDALEFSV